jgi:mono/diheme cytochrome c family protein
LEHFVMAVRRSLLSVLAAAISATSALAADVAGGEQLARRWCSACHLVAPNQQTPVSEAPPFAAIARRPDFNPASIAFFLLDPHPKMPDMGLSRAAAENLAAYIASLK